MEASVFERIRGSLLEKRDNLTDWLSRTPPAERQLRLGPADEGAVHAHLEVIDTSLEKIDGQTLGMCQVCHDYVDTALLEMDYTACICLDHFSAEEKRRLESELELSQSVQRALLPQHIPEIPGMQVAAFSRPAQIIGGDYFDFLQFRDGTYGLAIADVAGHGVSASLLMASLQTALRSLAPLSGMPTEVVERVNRVFYHNIHLTTFVTLFLGRFDASTDSLTYCNAGHNPPLLLHGDTNGGGLSWLQPTGAAVGLLEGISFGADKVPLRPGDVLILYTDGVTEATNLHGEEFGPQRLAEVAERGSGLPAGELVRGLRNALQAFTQGQPLADDTTVVACRRM